MRLLPFLFFLTACVGEGSGPGCDLSPWADSSSGTVRCEWSQDRCWCWEMQEQEGPL